MKYKRNGKKPYSRNGKPKETEKLNPLVTVAKQFDKDTISQGALQIAEDVKWMVELSKHEKFSINWALHILEELLYQSIGKKPVLVTNLFGVHLPSYVFKERGALDIIKFIGMLTENFTETLNINVNGKIEKKETKTLELKTSNEITSNVLDILLKSGAIEPGAESTPNAPLVEVHPA